MTKKTARLGDSHPEILSVLPMASKEPQASVKSRLKPKPPSDTLAQAAKVMLEDAKARNITHYPLHGKLSYADEIIVADATSPRHAQSVAEKLQSGLKSGQWGRASIEGAASANWIVVVIDSLVVHILQAEVRDYYQLDDLWRELNDPVKIKKLQPTSLMPPVAAHRKPPRKSSSRTSVAKTVAKKSPLKRAKKSR